MGIDQSNRRQFCIDSEFVHGCPVMSNQPTRVLDLPATGKPPPTSIQMPRFGIIGNLVTQYVTSSFSQHATQAALQATNAELTKRYQEVKAKIVDLQAKYDERFADESIRRKYTFGQSSGTFVHEGNHFCHPCLLNKSPPIESQLYRFDEGWKCRSCGTFHSRPTAR